mmetsp:Transcript_57184/g.162348  ORF Transcript_57184/g.162348 Transcript_57184/m.162348 type:complete len:256 (-) Transcript_57184:110-877(-)|eukprot:CAMPEP_0168402028 /NCGR_PEP_ID=MMETSP0228-20121227/23409_1 /TAXON_ID=133427 /ORGANISM="Protoceratium reticulatum, Strain CCCM 535 (=CCMP 1889)" /LENGTH=255 /DNA_ID=CAMNT_0008415601 /DNA_START=85 /DNA_END=852 /DNA_ORIENTATION=-
MNLNDIHKAQVSRFAAFFKGKSERVLADREVEKTDFITDRLADESAIFNYSDVRLLMETYHTQVMTCLREELEKTSNLSAVFIAQILAQAEATGTTLQVDDISVIEDQGRVGEIGALAAMNAPPLAPKPRTLSAVTSAGNADPNLLQELQDVREENRAIKERNLQMQSEISTVLRERSVLSAELDQANARAGGGNANVATEPNQGPPGDSAQFREMKSIVKKKTAEIKDLKQRLVAAGLALPDAGEGIELQADSD